MTYRKYYKKICSNEGALIEIDTDLSELKNSDIFGVEIYERTQPSPDHFIWRTYNLYYKGESEDIAVAGTVFNKIVKVEHYDHLYKGFHSTLCLSYVTSKGEQYTFTQKMISNVSDIINIIVAIIIISDNQNISNSEHKWQLLLKPSDTKSIELCIDEIREIKNLAKYFISKYPFLREIFKLSIFQRAEKIKSIINNMSLI